LFDNARATAWEKSTDSIADAGGGRGKPSVRRSSAPTDRAEKEENRANRAILVSLLQHFDAKRRQPLRIIAD
jgi:hypothetical protein